MAAYHTSLDLQIFWTELFKLFVAAFIVRSTACAINDVFDRKFDAGVGTPISHYTAPSHACRYRAYQGASSPQRPYVRLCRRRLFDSPIPRWRTSVPVLRPPCILGRHGPALPTVCVDVLVPDD